MPTKKKPESPAITERGQDVILMNIVRTDWPLLYEQKLCLGTIQQTASLTRRQRDLLEGLLNFLDVFTDIAEQEGWITEVNKKRARKHETRSWARLQKHNKPKQEKHED